MTYGELANTKYPSMEVNLIADDIANNARWGYSKKTWKDVPMSDHDSAKLVNAIRHYMPVVGQLMDTAIAIGLYEELRARAL